MANAQKTSQISVIPLLESQRTALFSATNIQVVRLRSEVHQKLKLRKLLGVETGVERIYPVAVSTARHGHDVCQRKRVFLLTKYI